MTECISCNADLTNDEKESFFNKCLRCYKEENLRRWDNDTRAFKELVGIKEC